MYEAKTKATKVPVSKYISAIPNEERRRDCRALIAMMKRVTGKTPKMWGPSIVGFGSFHYRYATGHEGDICEVGFSSRGAEIVVYLFPDYEKPETKKLLSKLGRHRHGKSCLCFRRLSDVDTAILERLVKRSVAIVRRGGWGI